MAAKEFHHGDQDAAAKRATYSAFMAMTKWGSLLLAATVAWLVLWFCTPAGFWTGSIVAVFLLIVGWQFLRKKPGPAAAAAH
jgi:hypothetical protein